MTVVPRSTPNAAETLAVNAYRSFMGPDRAREVAPGVVTLRADEAPNAFILNRVVGLGTVEPATREVLDLALEAMAGTQCYVSVSPDAQPAELAGWLSEVGFEPGWAWQQFLRGVEPLPRRPPEVTLVEVGPGEAESFGRVVAAGYGLPEAIVPLLANLHATDWTAWLALADDEPAGAAAIYVEGEGAYLGFAATLPEHRGKGAQTALLAARVDHARAAGCRWLATETGEQREGRPSNSYRNIVRAGFAEHHVVANWLGRP